MSPSSPSSEAQNVVRILIQGLDKRLWTPLPALPALPPHSEFEAQLRSMGVEPWIVPLESISDTISDEVQSERLGPNLKERSTRLAERIIREQIDIVITNTIRFYEGALAARYAGVPHIWIVDGSIRQDDRSALLLDDATFYATLDALSDRIVVISEAMQADIDRHIPSGKITRIRLISDAFPEVISRLLLEVLDRPRQSGPDCARLADDTIHVLSAAIVARAQQAELEDMGDSTAAIDELLRYPAYSPAEISRRTLRPGSPKVSVCIPVYNGASYLEQSIHSVLSQSYADFELIIVDDASTDASPAIIRSFDDPRIKYSRNAHNLGLIGNWNRCLELSAGEYVYLFHQDDIMLPGNLQQKVALLDREPQVGLVYSDVQVINHTGKIVAENWFELRKPNVDFVESGRSFFDLMFTNMNLICCPSVLGRRACYEQIGGFDQRLPFTGDMEMWMRAAIFFDIAYLARPLVQYRIHESNETQHHLIWNLAHLYLCKKMLLEKYPEQLASAYQQTLLDDSARRVFARVAHLYYEQQYKTAKQYLVFLDKIQNINTGAASRDIYDLYNRQMSKYVDQASTLQRIQQFKAELDQARTEVMSYRLSTSWRITQPIRTLGKFIRGKKNV